MKQSAMALITLGSAITGLLLAGPAAAHHGVTAHFDLSQPVVLEGRVVELEMRNPHSMLQLDVAGEDGTMERWHCEMHGTTILRRMNVTADLLGPGVPIRIEGFAQRRDDHGCYFDVGVLEDGRRIELGFLTGEQVPKAGKDAAAGTIFGTWIRKDFASVSQTVRRNFDVPLTEAGLAAHAAYDPIRDDPTLRCSPVSQIRVWGMATQPTMISRDGDDVLINHEWMDVRRPIDLAPFTEAPQDPAVLGHSRAQWQDNQLLITTTGFTAGVLNQFVENFAGQASTGILHSDQLTLTETLSVDAASDELVLEWTVEDPAYFSAPFSGTQRLVRSDLEIQPYNCVPDVE
jgi:hypothetical protein